MTNLEVNVSGRFHVLDQPYSAPSKCAFCGLGHNNDGEVRFIDTTLDLDFYGVVYICSNCLNEIAESLGYISNDKWIGLKYEREAIHDENEIVRAENDGLRSALNILTGHRCSDPRPARENKEEPSLNNEGSSSGTAEGIEPGKSEPDTSSSEPGLSDVRGTSEPKSIPDVLSKPRKSIKPVELDL